MGALRNRQPSVRSFEQGDAHHSHRMAGRFDSVEGRDRLGDALGREGRTGLGRGRGDGAEDGRIKAAQRHPSVLHGKSGVAAASGNPGLALHYRGVTLEMDRSHKSDQLFRFCICPPFDPTSPSEAPGEFINKTARAMLINAQSCSHNRIRLYCENRCGGLPPTLSLRARPIGVGLGLRGRDQPRTAKTAGRKRRAPCPNCFK